MMTAALSGARGGVCAFSPLMIRHFGAIDKGYVLSVREDFTVRRNNLLGVRRLAAAEAVDDLVRGIERAAFGFRSSAGSGYGPPLPGRPKRGLLPAVTPP